MLIDFNKKEEITIPGMNKETRTITAKMYMDEQRKIILCSIHAGGSIGLHKDWYKLCIIWKGKNGMWRSGRNSVCWNLPYL